MIVLHEPAEEILGASVNGPGGAARTAAEQAVEQSTVRFQAAFADAPIAMALFRLDRTTLAVNHALCAMLGYSEEELLATQFREITHPDDLELTIDSIDRVIAGEDDAYTYEKRYIRKDGQIVWALTSGSLVRDETGVPLYFASQQVDITARKEVEAERAVTHQQTRQLLDWITDGVISIDRQWRFSYINEAAERLLGRPRAELLGINVWAALPAALDTPFFAILHRAMTSGASESVEFLYPPLDIWFDARVYPSPEGLAVFLRDVTASRQAARELQESETKYRALIDNLPAVVYLQANDEEDTPLYFSSRFTELTGYSTEEALTPRSDFNWIDTVHPDDRERIIAENAICADNGGPFRVEYRYLRKDGRYIWVLDECLPVYNADGQIVAWQGVLLDISSRVRAEEARTRLAAIVESAEDAIVSRTLEGTIASWNHGAEKVYGYTAAEAIGQPVAMLLPPDVENDIPVLNERVKQGQSITGHETVRRTKDGRRIDVSIALAPVRDASGAIVAIASIARDVSALRQAEQALRLRDRALAAATNGIVITDPTLPDNPIVDFNPAFATLSGYTLQEAIGRNCRFLQGPDTDPAAVRRLRAAIAAGEDVTETILNYRQDGTPFWNDLRIAAVRDAAGLLTHFVGIQTDISERVEAEAALARLAAIVESAEDAILSCTLDGTITSWNRGAERLYGYGEQSAIGRSFTMLLPDGEDAAALSRTLASGAPASRYEAQWRRMDGTLADVSIAMSPIRDGQGETTGVSIITRDVSERKQVEQELLAALEASMAAAKTKTLFLAMMSHELRTPLQAVLGYADLLQLGPAGSLTAEQREDLGYIQGGGQRMIALIEQMLDLSRMEAGRLELAVEPVALATVIELVRQDIAPLAAARGLSVQIELPPALPAVLGDPGRLRQILLNLASNGIKFTEQGGVRITARASRGHVEIDVADTGIGIAAEALSSIFEEFRQVDGNLTRRYGGAGLGLAIARRLAEQMGGTISVFSSPGSGSTFTLHMPVAVPPRAKATIIRADPPAASAARPRKRRKREMAPTSSPARAGSESRPAASRR